MSGAGGGVAFKVWEKRGLILNPLLTFRETCLAESPGHVNVAQALSFP